LSSLFDTSAVIGLLERQAPDLIDLVTAESRQVAISTVTLGELERGAQNSRSPERRLTLSLAYKSMLHVPIDTVSGPDCFGFVASNTSRKVGGLDCWIAATAVVGGFDLVTQDRALAERLERIPWKTSTWRKPAIVCIDVS